MLLECLWLLNLADDRVCQAKESIQSGVAPPHSNILHRSRIEPEQRGAPMKKDRSAPFFRPRAHKGIWFPISLGLLVLVMLPGLLLLLLSLLGLEGVTNAWMQTNLNLTYHNALNRWATILLLLLPLLLA